MYVGRDNDDKFVEDLCPVCGGRGYVHVGKDRKKRVVCPHCKGSGRDRRSVRRLRRLSRRIRGARRGPGYSSGRRGARARPLRSAILLPISILPSGDARAEGNAVRHEALVLTEEAERPVRRTSFKEEATVIDKGDQEAATFEEVYTAGFEVGGLGTPGLLLEQPAEILLGPDESYEVQFEKDWEAGVLPGPEGFLTEGAGPWDMGMHERDTIPGMAPELGVDDVSLGVSYREDRWLRSDPLFDDPLLGSEEPDILI